jgi:capsular polysaccharide biosynthesis protein
MTPVEYAPASGSGNDHEETVADAQRRMSERQISRGAAVWRYKWLILLAAIVVAGATYGISSQISPQYQASSTVQVALLGGNASSEGVQASNDLASQYAQIVDSDPVIQAVSKRLGEPTSELRANLSGGTVNDQNLIAVRADAGQAQEATRRATAAARELVSYVTKTTVAQSASLNAEAIEQLKPLDTQIRRLQEQLADAPSSAKTGSSAENIARQQSLATLQAQRAASIGDIARAGAAGRPSLTVLNPAGGASKTEPKPALYTIAAFIIALLAAAQLVTLVRPRASVT